MSLPGRWARRALPALTTGAALGAVALATTGAASAKVQVSRPTTHLDVIEHAITDTEVPVAPGGKDEKGDPLTFTNPIYDATDSRQVGHDEGFCMRLDPKAGVWECLWTTFVSGGSITVQGPFYDTRNSTLAVTGGTGAYRAVHGSMLLKSIDGGKRYHFDFSLQSG